MILLYLLFPLLCIVSIPPSSRPSAFAERVVFGLVLYQIWRMAIGLILGLTGHLTSTGYVAATCCMAVALAAQSWKNGFRLDLAPVIRRLRTRRGRVAAILIALLAVVFVLEIVFDATYGTRHNDALMYHIPRVIFWLQQQSFEPWITPNWEQLALPVSANLVLGNKILLGGGWKGIGYVTALFSVGAITCVFLAAQEFRLTKWHAAMAAILFGSFPAVGLRIWAVNSDLIAAFPLLASFVALTRIREPKYGIAVFLLLNGVAIACKPTVAPYALLLSGVSLWRCRHKIAGIREIAIPLAGLILAAVIVTSSYWPVYATFTDFLGGDHGRGKKIATVAEFVYALAMSFGHWLLEPLGYLTPVMATGVKQVAQTVYNMLGENFITLPESWKPWPGQDISHTGLAALVFLPLLLYYLPSKARLPSSLMFFLGFISVSGMLCFTPYNSRYTVVLLAGFALLWGATRIFRRGIGRWILTGLCAINIVALLGVVVVRGYVDITVKMKPGGSHYYLSAEDRNKMAETLKEKPLLVMADDTLDALLWGTEIDYKINYITCPADDDWVQELRRASFRSEWLAVAYGGRSEMAPGPLLWKRIGVHSCPKIPVQRLNDYLVQAGWQIYRHNDLVDLWRYK